MKRHLACVALWAIMAVLLVVAALGIKDATITLKDVADATCQEDEACWNCSTMGNNVCGTVEP